MSAICDRLMLDSGTITPLLKKLEASGLVSRCRCSEDERCVKINLTDAGRELKQKAAGVPLAVSSCVTLEPSEAAQLYQLLYKILKQ